MKISDVKYLKKVCAVLRDKKQVASLSGLAEKLQEKGILWEAVGDAELSVAVMSREEANVRSAMAGKEAENADKGILYITDCKSVLEELIALKLPVLACYHAGNRGEDLSEARYAVEQPEEIEPAYLERVYRRVAGIPWDILETERLRIRESIPEDAEAFARIYGESAITRFMESLADSKVSNPEYFRQYARYVYEFYEFGIWTVIWKETGEVIGRVGFSMREAFEAPQLGYVIGTALQGRGFAKEACEGVLRYAQEKLGFEQIQVLIQTHNIPSLNLACQLGFVYERNLHIEEKEYQLLVKNYT